MTAVFSASQVVAGVAGVLVGRWLERAGPRPVMTGAAVLAVPALVLIAVSPEPWLFGAGWLVAGAAMAGLFYPPAFAAITRWFGAGRVRALTALTLVAGLASTVFAPLTAWLEAVLGWRGAYLVLAVVIAVVVVPVHAFALTPRWTPPGPGEVAEAAAGPATVGSVVAGRAFIALTLALTLGSFGVYAVVVNLVPLLESRGMSTALAAWALGVGGIGQVLGRLVYAPLERWAGPLARSFIVLGACAVTTALLAVVAGPVAAVMAVSLLAGMARGVFTLVQATAVTDRWGAERFAMLNGILHVPLMLAVALAPWAGSALAGPLGGYPAMFVFLAAVGALGAAVALFSLPSAPRVRVSG